MLKLGKDVKVHETATIRVEEGSVGDRSVISAHSVIEGRHVRIGNEAWIDEYAHIGGGGCFDPQSSLETGDFLHMGRFSHLNTGRGLWVGHEFGCGIGTKVFTHGAYESVWDGFPVQRGSVTIGDRVWMPNAWVNPNVRIGNDVVVAAMSLVTKDIPDGSLAGGIPCKVLREKAYPRRLTSQEKRTLFETIFKESILIRNSRFPHCTSFPASFEVIDEDTYMAERTVFNIGNRTIEGAATDFTEILKNQLRRNGIRFRFCVKGAAYERW